VLLGVPGCSRARVPTRTATKGDELRSAKPKQGRGMPARASVRLPPARLTRLGEEFDAVDGEVGQVSLRTVRRVLQYADLEVSRIDKGIALGIVRNGFQALRWRC
jgi:hypothetical protein